MDSDQFSHNVIKALKHSLLTILSFLFLTPYRLWVKSVNKLVKQQQDGFLNVTHIDGLWPLLSFVKRFFLDFCLDAITFLSFPIGVFVAVLGFVVGIIETNATEGMLLFFSILASSYFVIPVLCAILHDTTQLLLLPFNKFLSWCKKPAQQYDIDLRNRN